MALIRGAYVAHINFRWWLTPYIRILLVLSWLTGRDPDHDKLDAIVRRAIRTRIHFEAKEHGDGKETGA